MILLSFPESVSSNDTTCHNSCFDVFCFVFVSTGSFGYVFCLVSSFIVAHSQAFSCDCKKDSHPKPAAPLEIRLLVPWQSFIQFESLPDERCWQ